LRTATGSDDIAKRESNWTIGLEEFGRLPVSTCCRDDGGVWKMLPGEAGWSCVGLDDAAAEPLGPGAETFGFGRCLVWR
jgi:hypothetical protein